VKTNANREFKNYFQRSAASYYVWDISRVRRHVQRLTDAQSTRLLRDCQKALASPAIAKKDSLRVAAAKVVVALLPVSLPLIQAWLKRKERVAFEIQFSLFCFLDRVQYWKIEKTVQERILRMIHDYLMFTKTDTGQAAWMAGDLLGDHWRLSESLPVLLDVSKTAVDVCARKAALHGIREAFGRATRKERRALKSALSEVVERDRDKSVRTSAQRVLSQTNS
jgi:hypothetical protein